MKKSFEANKNYEKKNDKNCFKMVLGDGFNAFEGIYNHDYVKIEILSEICDKKNA